MQSKQPRVLLLTLIVGFFVMSLRSAQSQTVTATVTSAGGNTFYATVDTVNKKIHTSSDRYIKALNAYNKSLLISAAPLLACAALCYPTSKYNPYLRGFVALTSALALYSFIIKPKLKSERTLHAADVTHLGLEVDGLLVNAKYDYTVLEKILKLAVTKGELREPLENHALRHVTSDDGNLTVTIDTKNKSVTITVTEKDSISEEGLAEIKKALSVEQLFNNPQLIHFKGVLDQTQALVLQKQRNAYEKQQKDIEKQHALAQQELFEKHMDATLMTLLEREFISRYRFAPDMPILTVDIQPKNGQRTTSTKLEVTVSCVGYCPRPLPFSLDLLNTELAKTKFTDGDSTMRGIDDAIVEIATRLAKTGAAIS